MADAPIPITREEYAAIYGDAPQATVTPTPSISSAPIPITREEYAVKFGDTTTPAISAPLSAPITQQPQVQGSNILGQLGSGVLEGAFSMPGFLADVGARVPFAPQGQKTLMEDAGGIYSWLTGSPQQPRTTPAFGTYSDQTRALIPDRILASEPTDATGRIARTVGDFIGGGAVTPTGAIRSAPTLAKGGLNLAKQYGGDALAGLVFGSMEEAEAPLPLSMATSMLAGEVPKMGYRTGKGVATSVHDALSKEGTERRAGRVLRELAGDDIAKQIDEGFEFIPENELRQYRSTAEVAQNAPLAKMELEMAAGDFSQDYATKRSQRQTARENVIRGVEPTVAPTDEALGQRTRIGIEEGAKKAKKATDEAYTAFRAKHGDYEIPILKEKFTVQDKIAKLKKDRDFSLPKDVQDLVNEFTATGNKKSLGWIDSITGDAGDLIDQYGKSGSSKKRKIVSILSSIKSANNTAIDRAIGNKRIPKDVRNDLKLARAQRTYQGKVFEEKAVGELLEKSGRSGSYRTVNSKAFSKISDGTPETARQVKEALKADREGQRLIRAKILESGEDTAKRSGKEFTLAGFRDRFLKKRKPELDVWFNKEHLEDLDSIAKDIESASSVGDLATGASRGQSATSEKLTFKEILKSSFRGKHAMSNPVRTNLIKGLIERFSNAPKRNLEEVMWNVAMDPEYAKVMAGKVPPTQEHFKGIFSTAARDMARKGIISQATFEEIRAQDEYIEETEFDEFDLKEKSDFDELNFDLKEDRNEKNDTIPAFESNNKSGSIAGTVKQSIKEEAETKPAGKVEDVSSIIERQPPIIRAIIQTESGGDPKAISNKGARGLMQLMPLIEKHTEVKDVFDPEDNIKGGKTFFLELMEKYKDTNLAIAAYNAGEPVVNKAINKAGSRAWPKVSQYVPLETKKYVPRVLGYLKSFNSNA